MTTKRAPKRLTQMYIEWQQAQQRMQMALQTLTGAQQDTLDKEVRFKAEARLRYGSDATWEYTDHGLQVKLPPQPNGETKVKLARKR